MKFELVVREICW